MKSYREQKAENERDRVALMLVDPSYTDLFLNDDASHFYVQSAWEDKKLHAMFCLICELRAVREPVGYMKRLHDRGKEILEQRKNADNTDSLED